MKDIQKIKEFFFKPVKESLTGGYPHTKTSGENFEKITITEPIDDATKNMKLKLVELQRKNYYNANSF